jgi:HSP20 family protein
MRLTSLVPFREAGALMRPGFGLFGLHREIDRLFNEFAQGAGPGSLPNIVPNIEISETDKAIEVSAEMPGLERKDVEISIEDDTLTIRGEKKIEEDNNKDKNVQHSERSYGVFLRVLQLPPGIDPASVQATMSNGVLKITIPKPAKPEPKKIEVKEPPQTEDKKAA